MALIDALEAVNKVLQSGVLMRLSGEEATFAASFILCSAAMREHAMSGTMLTLDEYFEDVIVEGLQTLIWPQAKKTLAKPQ